jgi:hypothetical protein
MTRKIQPFASSLDIWGVVKEVISYDDTESTISDVMIYLERDISLMVIHHCMGPVHIDGFKLTEKEADKMFSKLIDYVNLPESIDLLHIHLNANMIPKFTAEFYPEKRA